MKKILIIKHGALGDIILSTPAFKAIRSHHQRDNITLITTPPYVKLLSTSPFFDDIKIDYRPKPWQFGKILNLLKILRGDFDMVYDLQTSRRSSFYYNLLPKPKPDFSGVVKNASHCHHYEGFYKFHTLERHREQLEICGIKYQPKIDLTWLKDDISKFNLQGKYVLIITGCSMKNSIKRWTENGYIKLCQYFIEKDIIPVLIGGNDEKDIMNKITQSVKKTVNLCNQTSLGNIAELSRNAEFCIGGDTGPIHLAAAADGNVIALFSGKSDPKLSAPIGNVKILRKENLQDLTIDELIKSVESFHDTLKN